MAYCRWEPYLQSRGWYSLIRIDDLDPPILNYFNTVEDRKEVIGEKSLNISDNIDFKRKVYQFIESSQFVNLPNGNYFLSAKARTIGELNFSKMYAESKGKIEVGFTVDGKANLSVLIDDVCLANLKICDKLFH